MRVQIDSRHDLLGYSEFKDIEEFITNIEIWLIDTRKKFTKGELIGLEQLIHSSSDIPGVCQESIGKIVCYDFEKDLRGMISRSTFKRMVRKGIDLGLLKVYETNKRDGSQGGNLYVFAPYPPFLTEETKIDFLTR
ncbi:hypothetical protein [Ferdinandcohnia sp. Marseille-Q9671]